MKYLIDTNICIYIINKHPAGVIKKFKQFQQRLEQFTAPLEILTYDEMAAEAYGDIRFQLEKDGLPIGPLDLLIAAHALSQKFE